MPLSGLCSVIAELLEPVQQDTSSTEILTEAPGSYGFLSRDHAVGVNAYETASALASDSSPDMVMALWHTCQLDEPQRQIPSEDFVTKTAIRTRPREPDESSAQSDFVAA